MTLSNDDEGNKFLEAAMAYAKQGFFVIPLRPRDKRPLINEWPKKATTNRDTIKDWWNGEPEANVGLVTGRDSNLIVLDIDDRHGGEETLKKLERQHGKLPPTIESCTGGGGRHLLFRHPGNDINIKNSTGKLGPGLDIKTDGGYIVVPPSEHPDTGRSYTWKANHWPNDIPPASLPQWVRSLLKTASQTTEFNGDPTSKIPDGQRDSFLTSQAGAMRRRGFSIPAIRAALLVENQEKCCPPLPQSKVEKIVTSISRYPGPRDVLSPLDNPQKASSHSGVVSSEDLLTHDSSPWSAAQPAPTFLAAQEKEVVWLRKPLLARGNITEMFSPRGIGKTHVAIALAVELALEGTKVLYLNRDNPVSEVKRRLRHFNARQAVNLKVMNRDETPPLTDKNAWALFPIHEYDLVIVDSLDSSAEGIGEQDSSKPSRAISPLLDLAHQTNGLAIWVLGNTIKSGEHSRGSGVVEDRADICFEVRDATGLQPTGTKDWWLELPSANASAWGERASRRKQRDTYRLAVIPSKFRVGEEPNPFILEINLAVSPWTVTDVTTDVIELGVHTKENAQLAHSLKVERALDALVREISDRFKTGSPMLKEKDAVPFLILQGVKREEARAIIENHDGARWAIKGLPRPGKPKALFPLTVGQSKIATAEKDQSETPEMSMVERTPISADRINTGPRKSYFRESAPAEAFHGQALFPREEFEQEEIVIDAD